MHAIRRGLFVLCLIGAAAAARAAASPEDVVRAFVLAIQADGPAATVPRFTHPDERARFKELLMPRIRRNFSTEGAESSKSFLGRVMPLKEIEAMPPFDFMTAFFKNRNMRVDGLKFKPPKFLGSVRENDLVHLVVRTELVDLEGAEVSRLNLLSVKPLGDTWKMMLSNEMEALATALAR
jgi:hypothetical protein